LLAQFESWDGYRKFSLSVQRKARHVFEDHVYKFLEAVIATSEKRKRELPIDRFLWRAQQGDHWEEVSVEGETFPDQQPLPPNRMKPLPHSAREGRVNPKGIPCLYLATDKDTAMAEIRPWIGSYISVGQFKTLRNLNLVDCSIEHARGFTFYRTEPDPAKREEAVWAEIDSSFSEPKIQTNPMLNMLPHRFLLKHFEKTVMTESCTRAIWEKGSMLLFLISMLQSLSIAVFLERNHSNSSLNKLATPIS
jgi:hypothetical protein